MNKYIAKDLGVKQEEGALIVQVLKNSAADKAGLRPYDIITRVNKTKIESSSDLSRAVTRIPIGKRAKLEVYRADKRKILFATLKSNPESKTEYEPKSSKPPLTRSQESTLYKTYGFEISNLTSALRKEFEIANTGKHRAVIERVVGYSVASRAGLRPGDVIYEINRKPIFSAESAISLFESSQTSFLVRIKRGDAFAIVRIEK